ncbi:MAG: hypothetical protein H7338_12865 [Candidatus Sericytochromatia bacterium]|nr:hypothetical protein [Candidatus Sericytochromatia bacterium]
MSRITFAGREVEALHVDKGSPVKNRMTQPLDDAPMVQFSNPAGDEYFAFVEAVSVGGLRPGTAGLYEHDGVTEEVTVTAIVPARGRPLGSLMVSTGVITVLLGALIGTMMEPGAGTALGAAAALIGSIGVGMPLAALAGNLPVNAEQIDNP